ncbi:MAG: hypothetical protein V3T11_04615 [Roseateles sp.]
MRFLHDIQILVFPSGRAVQRQRLLFNQVRFIHVKALSGKHCLASLPELAVIQRMWSATLPAGRCWRNGQSSSG